jgi:hypothetical protein
MKKSAKELQKIKGVGEVLTKRFITAGYTSFEAIVAAGEEGLKKIKGVNPQLIPSILDQANALAAEGCKAREQKVADSKAALSAIRKQVAGIAQAVKERPVEELQGRTGSKMKTQLSKMRTALKKVEGSLGKRVKKEEKKLAKAGKYLAELSADTAVKGIGSRLKKARKSLKKIYA